VVSTSLSIGLAGTALVAGRTAFAADAVYKEFVQGNLKAKVTVIEYASLTCPHCAHFMQEEYPKLKKEYIDTGKIKFIYRDFPLDNLAMGAAVLSRCVPGDRGHVMVEMMFKNQLEWIRAEKPLEVLRGYAQLAGLDSAGVDACLKRPQVHLAGKAFVGVEVCGNGESGLHRC